MDKRKDERIIGPWGLAFRRFRKNKLAIVGAIIFVLILGFIIIGPLFSPYYPADKINTSFRNQPPSADHLLGTDTTGRDVLLRLMLGGRVSLLIALMATAITAVIGTVIGGIAGFYGKWVDSLLMRFTEVVMAFPFIPTVVTVSFALQNVIKPDDKKYVLAFILGVFSWGGLARIVRGQLLTLKEQEFMVATNALGLSTFSKIFKHLIPNTLGYIMIFSMLTFAGNIISEAGLSFLGLGVPPDSPSWGIMLQAANNSMNLRLYPFLWIPPGIALFLSVVSINLLGEGLRDAFDPKQNVN